MSEKRLTMPMRTTKTNADLARFALGVLCWSFVVLPCTLTSRFGGQGLLAQLGAIPGMRIPRRAPSPCECNVTSPALGHKPHRAGGSLNSDESTLRAG